MAPWPHGRGGSTFRKHGTKMTGSTCLVPFSLFLRSRVRVLSILYVGTGRRLLRPSSNRVRFFGQFSHTGTRTVEEGR